MYKIIGSDGKEYGPISLEQLQQWRTEGRINAQTRVQGPAGAAWKAAADFPELGFGAPPGAPGVGSPYAPPVASGQTGAQEKGLAITSLVLGILSMVGFCGLTGIPAIICGHIARGRVRRSPAQYAGSGMALAGLIMGYLSIVMTFLVLPALLLPALSRAKGQAQRINCVNNMKQAGIAFKMWELGHQDQFPFNVDQERRHDGILPAGQPGARPKRLFAFPRDVQRTKYSQDSDVSGRLQPATRDGFCEPPACQRELPALFRHECQRRQSRTDYRHLPDSRQRAALRRKRSDEIPIKAIGAKPQIR
jgi:hypothetical protein